MATNRWTRLGQLLMRKGSLSHRDLVATLMAQLIYGGRLGTNLVELGATSIGRLNAELAAQWQIEAWPADAPIHPAAVALLQPEAAQHHLAIPTAITTKGCAVIMMEPSQARIERLEAELNQHVFPFVAPELRMHYLLEQHHKIPRPARFLRLPDGTTRPQSERRRYLSPSIVSDRSGERAGWQAQEQTGLDEPRAAESLNERARAVATAQSGAEVARRLVEPPCPEARLDLLFWVRGNMAIACNAWGVRATMKQLQDIVVSLDAPSALRHAYRNRETLHCAADSIHAEIAERLGAPPPKDICIAPVLLDDRVVNLVSVCAADAKLPSSTASELRAVTTAANSAYTRLREQLKKST